MTRPLRAVVDEAAFNTLVGGEVADLVAHPGNQELQLILSDIGWPRIFGAVRRAYERLTRRDQDLESPYTGLGRKITRLYAWIVTNEAGNEAVLREPTPEGLSPLIGADRQRIENGRDFARRYQRRSGFPVRLVSFEMVVELERLLDG